MVRLRWSRGERAGLWYPSSRVQTRPKPSDFSGEKILSAPSFGGEVMPSVPCRKFTACKWNPKVTWKSPLSAKFSEIPRPYFHLPLLGFACVVSEAGDSLWRKVERSKSLVLQVGGLTCRWQRHSVKTFLLRILRRKPKGLQSRLNNNNNNNNNNDTWEKMLVLCMIWPTNVLVLVCTRLLTTSRHDYNALVDVPSLFSP